MEKVLIRMAQRIPCWNNFDSTSSLTFARHGPSSSVGRWEMENISELEELRLLSALLDAWWWWERRSRLLGLSMGVVTVSTGADMEMGWAFLSDEIKAPQSGNPETGLVPKATCGKAPRAPLMASSWGQVKAVERGPDSCSIFIESLFPRTWPRSIVFSSLRVNLRFAFIFNFRIEWAISLKFKCVHVS